LSNTTTVERSKPKLFMRRGWQRKTHSGHSKQWAQRQVYIASGKSLRRKAQNAREDLERTAPNGAQKNQKFKTVKKFALIANVASNLLCVPYYLWM
jgi:hypothetical protein